ncbi:hypothetical protein BG20_I2269, partial [Candidatus Nitrosarchaeum limnium BG20]
MYNRIFQVLIKHIKVGLFCSCITESTGKTC